MLLHSPPLPSLESLTLHSPLPSLYPRRHPQPFRTPIPCGTCRLSHPSRVSPSTASRANFRVVVVVVVFARFQLAMAGVLSLLATSIQPAFVSPHRKRKWRCRRVMMMMSSSRGNHEALFHRKRVELDWRIGRDFRVGWSLRMRPGSIGIDASGGIWKRRFVMSALPGIDFAMSKLELAPVESVSTGGDLVFWSQFLVDTVLDPHVQVVAFVLGVLVLAIQLAGEGRVFGRGDGKSLEVVSRPSPFNVFVSKRCPSISSPSESLAFGRKEGIRGGGGGGDQSRPVYQRKCLPAADGGVVAIDWPAQLDLAGEDGFDSVLLLVPGTTEGSRDDGVEKFVMDAMRLGYFPVVLNPRGCAGSPLITPRVFTAADSDDVRLVIQHIMSAQPRAMVMGVGWGFGSNMLAKHLGEEAGSSSLLAAVCISNPFDLQETSRHLSSTGGGKFDRAMANGLIGILEANKMLFVGEKKGYDLNKALAATSVREFEAAISKVAYGFETLEGFYAAASSINSISTVQTPLLFIQGEDDAIPVSVPRQTIEANPYTTAIVAESPTNTAILKEETVKEPGSASRHYRSHTIALEWLAAVELALLKGRHPCLDAINLRGGADENVSVSSGLPTYGQTEDKKPVFSNHKVNAFKVMTEQTTADGGQEYNEVAPGSELKNDVMGLVNGGLMVDGSESSPVPRLDNVDEDDFEISDGLNRTRDKRDARGQEKAEMVVDGAANGSVSKAGDTEAKKTDNPDESARSEEQNGASEEEAAPLEEEPEEVPDAIQMRMAAESVMNVLDITMPGTLTDEKKTQVLSAVGRGDTILTALQEAVPEEVRGSMAGAVSGAVQARGLSFNLVGFGKSIPPPSLPAGLISSIKGKLEAGSGEKQETVSEPPPISTGEPQKQNQEGHESGNNNSEHHSKESGSREKSKTEDPKSEEHGPLDPQNSRATHPETSDSKMEKTHDSGAKANGPDEVEGKEKSDKEKGSPGGATNDPNHPEGDMAKDSNGEVSNLKERIEGKLVGGKSEENTEGQEKSDNKEVENKDGGRKAPDDQMEQKDGKQPGNIKDSNEPDVKEESKPEGAKEENKPEGVEKENKPEAPKEETKPEAAKEETKPEGDNVPSPGTPDPVTAASTPSPAPMVPPPVSDPTPPTTGMGPPVDMGLALEALTGFDDSTQMAVTNVFGVVESMLEQMEKDQQDTGPYSSNGSKGATPDQEQENEKEKSDGEKEKRVEGQKPSGLDSSDDSKMPTADHENKLGQEESDRGKEQREKQQKASEPSPPASELTGDDENGSDREKANQFKTKSTHNTHREDGEREAAATSDKNLAIVDDGSNIQNIDGAEKNSSARRVDVKASETEGGKFEKPENTSDDNQKFRELPFPLSFECDRYPVQRSFSKVLTTCRVGSSLFVTSVSNFEAPEVTNGIHVEQNVASSGFVPTSRDFKGVLPKEGTSNGAGPQTHPLDRTSSLSRDVKVTTVIPHKVEMTLEQLIVEVDRESQLEPDKDEGIQGTETIEVEATGIKEEKCSNTVENMVADALKLEVLRRLGVAGMESLGVDLEKEVAKVADAIAGAVKKWKQEPGSGGSESGKLGILESDSIVSTLGSAVSNTSILGGLVPIGVLAGVVLASLGAVYLIVTDQQGSKKVNKEEKKDDDDESPKREEDRSEGSSWQKAKVSALDVPVLSVNGHAQVETDEAVEGPRETSREEQIDGTNNNKLKGMMAAAVSGGVTLAGMSSTATKDQDNRVTANEEKAGTERRNPSIVSSFHPLAEKALSVAAPVVPTNEDGEVDHERLVAMLADLGQRGGFFRLVGKVALLWGGLRGAMSLTDRLLVFLHMKERPLYLRLVGFAAMIVLLWSPVLVPVLPSFLQQWATKSPNGVANAASVVGLYGAILILITIWGKRVRGYSKPLLYYGLRLYSWRKLRDLISGLALGCTLVTALYTTNVFLGYVQLDWKALLATNTRLLPRLLPGAVGVTIFTTMKMLRLLGMAFGIGLAVSLVEEVLFRSWLQEEIAVDFGFHGAVFLSALVFSIVHWSPAAIPGLYFLGVALAGARAQTGRNLALPIGLHAGLVAANYVATVGGVVRFLPHAPTWFTGAHVANPLAGALGTAMTAMLAVILYPRTEIRPPAVAVPIDSDKEVGAQSSS